MNFCVCIFIVISSFLVSAHPFSENDIPSANERTLYSNFLKQDLIVKAGVFPIGEAEDRVLPYMKKRATIFKNAKVLDVGSGSGIIALYAVKLGAASVVATDIDPNAIATINLNKRKLVYSDQIEARLVAKETPEAFSTIGEDEKFDIIISNPPYSLELSILENTVWADTGVLGLSLVSGLKKHLTKNGTAILYFGNHFYQQVIVKYAKQKGLLVIKNEPADLAPWQLQTLYNMYLRKFSDKYKLNYEKLEFNFVEEKWLKMPVQKGKDPQSSGFIELKIDN